MILIKNVRILGDKESNVLIEGNKISSINGEIDKSDIVIDGKDKALIPGLMNCHTHAAMVLFRSYAEDMYLHEWLEKKIWPAERKLDEKAVYYGTKLACIEMLKSGCTFFNDMYFYAEAIAKAVEDTGIRACISSAFFDFFDKDLLEKNIKRVERDVKALKKYERVLPAVGPHAVYTVSLEGLRMAKEIADEYNAFIHFHLAETEREVVEFKKKHGKSIVSALDEIGFLCDKLICAHSVWLDENEIELLSKRGVNVAHCPTSNMKLCVGKALNYSLMRKYNVNVTLGTDGAASNNNLDMFEEMKFASLLQKFYYNDPTIVKAREIFDMTTSNPAKAFKLKVGEIKEGYLADLVLIDLKKPYMIPGHDFISDLVYSANSSCVDTVIVDGKVLVENGKFEGEEEVYEKVKEIAFKLVE